MRCRPLLIAADLARAALLGSVPVAAVLGVLSLAQLDAVSFLVGIGTSPFQAANDSIMMVFLVRQVHLRPGTIGLLGMTGLFGALAAAGLTGRIAARLGSACTLWISALVNGVGFLLYPLTDDGVRMTWYVLAGGLAAFSIVTRHIMAVSARQLLCPPQLLGRVSATMELMTWGMMPLGALAGGLLSTYLGLRPTLVVAGVLIALASLWLLASPLRTMRDLPTAPPTPAATG